MPWTKTTDVLASGNLTHSPCIMAPCLINGLRNAGDQPGQEAAASRRKIFSKIGLSLYCIEYPLIKLSGAGRDVGARRPLRRLVGRLATAPHLMSSSVYQLRLHFSDVGAGESASGVDLCQPFLGLLQSSSGVDGEEAELGVDVGIGDVLLDIVVTLEPHGKDLAPGK